MTIEHGMYPCGFDFYNRRIVEAITDFAEADLDYDRIQAAEKLETSRLKLAQLQRQQAVLEEGVEVVII